MNLSYLLLLKGTLITSVILFIWSGIAANLPFGIKSVVPVAGDSPVDQALRQHASSGMYYFRGNQVAAFTAIRPASYYLLPKYFAWEYVTQLCVALLLCVLLSVIMQVPGLTLGQKLLFVGIVSLFGGVASDGSYWNWWGFSAPYVLGVVLSRLVGHLIAAWVLLRWIL